MVTVDHPTRARIESDRAEITGSRAGLNGSVLTHDVRRPLGQIQPQARERPLGDGGHASAAVVMGNT